MKFYIKLTASVALLAVSIYLLDISKILEAAEGLSVSTIFFAMTLCLLHFIATGIRWWVIVSSTAPGSFLFHLKIYFYSNFLNTMTPANLGGDVYRTMALRKSVGTSMPIVLCLVRERVVGLAGYLGVFLLAYLFGVLNNNELPEMYTLCAMASLLFFLSTPFAFRLLPPLLSYLKNRRQRRIFDAFTWVFQAFQVQKSQICSLMILSLLATAAWCSTVMVVAVDLEIDIAWWQLAMLVVLVELVKFIPISIQGIGVREGAYAYLIALLNYPPENGFVLGAVAYLILGVALIASGCLSFLIPSSLSHPNS